jgi:hypothetical protein
LGHLRARHGEIAYPLTFFSSLLLPPRYAGPAGQLATILEFCELPIIFWLVVWGARPRPSDQPPPDAAIAR